MQLGAFLEMAHRAETEHSECGNQNSPLVKHPLERGALVVGRMRLIALNNFRADRDALLKKKIALEKKSRAGAHPASDPMALIKT